jgi:hypothetical protein
MRVGLATGAEMELKGAWLPGFWPVRHAPLVEAAGGEFAD